MAARVRFSRHFALAIALMVVVTMPARAAFDHLVVFGDSLSDIGNAGRFSDGAVWVEHLATRLGVSLGASESGGFNFAVGGARLDAGSGPYSLPAQVDLFRQRARPPGRSLYVIYGGGNDVLAAVQSPDPRSFLERAVGSFKDLLAALVEGGAREALVPNLPDIGITPAVQASGAAAGAAARRLTARFNEAVDGAIAEVQRAAPDLRVYRLDVWELAEQVRAAPARFGFRNITTPCGMGDCDGYLFWDQVHPTAQAHARLGEAAVQVINAVP